MTEDEQRAQVRDIARTWIGTPYHHRAGVKGVGVDCARILIEVFAEAGLMERFNPPKYSRDWHLHRNEEVYLANLEVHISKPIKEAISPFHLGEYKPLMGDVLVFRVGRTFSHSAIVTEWPRVVHASAPSRFVEEINIMCNPDFMRPVRVYSIWGEK